MTNFPNALDTFVSPTASDRLNSATVTHSALHTNTHDALAALEAKVGADGSAVQASHDYKIAALEAAVADAGGGSSGATLAAEWGTDATKTNIGTAFVDVYNLAANLNGERKLIDVTGRTQVRAIIRWNRVGTGTQEVRLVDAANVANVLATVTVPANAGEKEIDSGWVPLPAWATAEAYVKPQARSSTAGDDPIFRRAQVFLK